MLEAGYAGAAATSHWAFEETSGTTVVDAIAGNNGVLKNGVTRNTGGAAGRLLTFDGVNDYVDFGDKAVFESQQLTISMWVRRSGAQGDWAKLITKGSTNLAPWGSYKIEFNGANDTIVNWHVGFTDGTSASVTSTTPLVDSQWTHLAVTYDGTTLNLYLNGVLEGTTAVSGKAIQFDGVPLTLGGSAGWGYFKGRIDELQYFNRALTPGEIQAIYSVTAPVRVTTPNAATSWVIGSVQTIAWSHNLPASSTSRVELSRNGGATWTTLASSVANASPTGSYKWTVSGPVSTQAKVRVIASSAGAADEGDAAFAIATPAITVTTPNLVSDMWIAGQNATVAWTSNLGTQASVNIELSLNGGSTYQGIVSGAPNSGSQTIAVQPGWITGAARVRVRWAANPSAFDVSDGNFTIQGQTPAQVSFQATGAAFANPERGFYTWTDFLTQTDFSNVRAAGNTITRPYIRLDAYRDQALPQSLLDQIHQAFGRARQAGIKVIPRFSYNFGPYPNPAPDASRQTIKQHLLQLAPVLAANEDVIVSLEAGFIGAWGEWHTSTNGLDTDPAAKADILNAILSAVPASRMVALRYPSDMQLLNGIPITASEAFTGTNRARIGSHQDCFLASDDDWGTWGRSGNAYSYDKAYVAENGRFAVVGGETCNPNPPRSDCPTALSELASMHWSYLNKDYEPGVLAGWQAGGCLDEIDRRLGYRFVLSTATFPQAAQRGGIFQLSLQLANQGFAAMFNARPVFAVLSNGTAKYTFPINSDPRFWTPGAVTTIGASFTLPANMTPGTYALSVWLPDQAASLRANPQYSVRFANQGVWDANSGYNVLSTTIGIVP